MIHDLIIWIGGFSLGFWIGEIYVRRQAMKLLAQIVSNFPDITETLNVTKLTEEHSEKETHPLHFTEEINGSIMLYDVNTSSFVCQGKSLEELAQNAKNFKHIARSIVRHADELLFFIDGEVKRKFNESKSG